MTLLTLAEAKTHLNIGVSTYDAELQPFVDAVPDLIESYIGGPAETRSVVETVELLDYGRAIQIVTRFFQSLTSLTSNGVTIPTTDVYVTRGRALRRRMGQCFTPSIPPMVATIQAGVAAVAPGGLKHASKIIVAHTWETQRGRSGGRGPSANSEPPSVIVAGLAWTVPNRALQWMAPWMPETGWA